MQNNTDNQVYAGFFVRLAAYLIDWIIVGAALLVIRIPIWIASIGGTAEFVLKDFIFQYSIYDIVLYVLKVTYFVLLTYFTGSTLGKKLLQIRVISTEDRKPTFFEIVFRESVGKFLSTIIMYVGYIMIGADKKKRGLHDMLSDTYVVYHHQKNVAVPTPVIYNRVPYAVPAATMPPYQQSSRPVQQPADQLVQQQTSNQVAQQSFNQPMQQQTSNQVAQPPFNQPVQQQTPNQVAQQSFNQPVQQSVSAQPAQPEMDSSATIEEKNQSEQQMSEEQE